MAADICPETRARCDMAEVCRMVWCAKRRHPHKPIREDELTVPERYALRMAEQRARPPGARPGR